MLEINNTVNSTKKKVQLDVPEMIYGKRQHPISLII